MGRSDPRNIQIRIRAGRQERYEAEIGGVYRRALEPFLPPYSEEEVQRLLSRLDCQVPASSRRDLPEGDAEPGETALRELERLGEAGAALKPDDVGQALFHSLFQGEVAEKLGNSLSFAEGSSTRLRIWLDFEEDESLVPIAALPWELLRQPDRRGNYGFFCQHPSTPILRYFDVPTPQPSLRIEPPLRLLAVSSSPIDLDYLSLEQEWEEMLGGLGHPGTIERKLLNNPTLQEVHDHLKIGRYHILHFMGHGGFEKEQGEGFVCFTGDDGCSKAATGTMLRTNLMGLSDLRLVVLNLCRGGALPRRRGQNPFLAVAPAILRAGVPAVLAMQFPISDQAAITFSRSFYTQLAQGAPVDIATTEARLAVYNEGSLEWVTPALFLSTMDGRIFDLRPAEPTAVPASEPILEAVPPEPREKKEVLRLGIRTFSAARSFAPNMKSQTDSMLCLGRHFGDRFIKDDALWQSKILPRLDRFLRKHTAERRPLFLDLATHLSVAFAAGYFLDQRSGLEITVNQRSHRNPQGRHWSTADVVSPTEPLWVDELSRFRSPYVKDVAFAISISRSVIDDVEDYLDTTGPTVRRILMATLNPKPNRDGVRDGNHALQLAQSLYYEITSRPRDERDGTLHIFISAPHSVAFFLGQLCHGVGRIQLYEHEFDYGRSYRPSLRLPYPPAPGA